VGKPVAIAYPSVHTKGHFPEKKPANALNME
jgi:hypothetical protein